MQGSVHQRFNNIVQAVGVEKVYGSPYRDELKALSDWSKDVGKEILERIKFLEIFYKEDYTLYRMELLKIRDAAAKGDLVTFPLRGNALQLKVNEQELAVYKASTGYKKIHETCRAKEFGVKVSIEKTQHTLPKDYLNFDMRGKVIEYYEVVIDLNKPYSQSPDKGLFRKKPVEPKNPVS